MNVIVCIDEAGGMLFNGRRQSKDKCLRQKARELAQGEPLWMNSYTASQFAEDGYEVVVDEDFLSNAPENAWCFVENRDLLPWIQNIQQVAVYHWNRRYPSDVKFPMDVLRSQWKRISDKEFAGNSHERITEEVYTR